MGIVESGGRPPVGKIGTTNTTLGSNFSAAQGKSYRKNKEKLPRGPQTETGYRTAQKLYGG